MRARIQRWGNSLALRIPKAIAADAKLRQESEVNLVITDGKLIVTPIGAPTWDLDELLKEVTPDNLHGEAESGPPAGVEAW